MSDDCWCVVPVGMSECEMSDDCCVVPVGMSECCVFSEMSDDCCVVCCFPFGISECCVFSFFLNQTSNDTCQLFWRASLFVLVSALIGGKLQQDRRSGAHD